VKEAILAAIDEPVSEIGLGGWQLGGKGWGSYREHDARRVVARACDLGIRLFDTAPIYGFGHAEELLGETLLGHPDPPVVITKGGLVWDDQRNVAHDNGAASLRRQLEGSLRRLRRDAIDVYLLHWPDPRVPLEESAAALETFRTEGLIRGWGLSNFCAKHLRRWATEGAHPNTGLVLEVPLNLLGRTDDGKPTTESQALGTLAQEYKWDVVAYDVLARGLLGGAYTERKHFGKRDVRRQDARFQGEAFRAHLQRVESLKRAASELRVSPSALAIRALLDTTHATACIVGMRTPEQVEENVRAATIEIPADTLASLSGL
jgi:aryl-alcohol dehydrogenase-like predicted oxidoreductase